MDGNRPFMLFYRCRPYQADISHGVGKPNQRPWHVATGRIYSTHAEI